MTAPIKIDNRITLRSPDPAYAEALMRIVTEQNTYLLPWLPWVKKTGNSKDLRRMLRNFEAFNQGGQQFTTFIFFDHLLAGSIGLMRIDRTHRRGEIGYWLRQELQGRGIITRCCRWLIPYAFDQLLLHRLEIRVPSHNERSLAIPQRLGFRHEGTLRQYLQLDGRFHDMEVFGLLKEDGRTEEG
jgi:ribosomal-protein-serine acetyltransferase